MRTVLFALFLPAALAAQTTQFGGARPGFRFDSPSTRGFSCVAGDFDGDGWTDVLVGGAAPQIGAPLRGVVHRNHGGVLVDETTARLTALRSEGSRLVLGDFDNDGDPDLVVSSRSFLGGVLFRNDAGVFVDASNGSGIASTLVREPGLVAADLDGDGDLDVVRSEAFGLAFYRNDGTARFVRTTIAPSDHVASAVAGDVDGDGDLDLVLGQALPASSGPSHKLLFRNDGTGSFTQDVLGIAPTRSVQTRGMALVDLDGDQDLDLVAANDGQPPEVFRNVNGRFTAYAGDGLSTDSPAAKDVLALDVDHDGDRDLLFAIADEPSRLFVNQGNGTFQPAPAAVFDGRSRRVQALAVADVDRDGFADVVHVDDGFHGVWYGHAGGLADPDVPRPGDSPRTFRHGQAGDVDGDQQIDVVAVDDDNDIVVFHGQHPFGHEERPTGLDAPQPGFLQLFDADGDADLDLLVAVGTTSQVLLYRNPGDGSFGASTGEQIGATQSSNRVLAADLDGDGALDLVRSGSQRVEILWNSGTGTFPISTQLATFGPSSSIGQIAAGDIDGDGRLDLVFDELDRALRAFRNLGTRTFTDVTATSLPGQFAGNGAALGDLDGDGDLDLLLGERDTSLRMRVLANDGNGVFASAWTPPSSLRMTGRLQLVDIDLDGDLDVVGYDSAFGLRVLVNEGAFSFTPSERLLTARSQPSQFELVDLDRDRDPDLVTFGEQLSGLQIRWNAAQQTHVDSAVHLGAHAVVRVLSEVGHATEPGLVALAGDLVLLPQPASTPFGLFALAQPLLFGLHAVAAAEPGSTFLVPLPADPALLSTPIHWQGATWRGTDPAAIRFTNVARHLAVP